MERRSKQEGKSLTGKGDAKWTLMKVDDVTPRDNILLAVMELLKVRDLVACAMVSRRWRRCSYNSGSWKRFYLLELGPLKSLEMMSMSQPVMPATTWREKYIEFGSARSLCDPGVLRVRYRRCSVLGDTTTL